jgi:hypothetical protein
MMPFDEIPMIDDFRTKYTPEQRLALVRDYRNGILFATDHIMLYDSPYTDEQREAWRVYRQQIRDFMATYDPTSPEVSFPDTPGA